jgi:hypothetical protein
MQSAQGVLCLSSASDTQEIMCLFCLASLSSSLHLSAFTDRFLSADVTEAFVPFLITMVELHSRIHSIYQFGEFSSSKTVSLHCEAALLAVFDGLAT